MSNGKREGMERAERGANPHWWQMALEGLRYAADNKPQCTSDDVWEYLGDRHPNATTNEHRAMGPLMVYGAKLGFIEKVPGRWIKSRRGERHDGTVQVWSSKLYKGPIRIPRPRGSIYPYDPNQHPLFFNSKKRRPRK